MLISWNTTKKCNLNCVHCYRESGMDVDTSGELTTKEGKKLIDEISKAGFRLLILSGGEPLLRKDIFELIGAAKEARLASAMGTNGTLLTREIAGELFKAGLKGVAISIDSLDQKYHDEFRGCPGAFDKTQEGVENALSAGLQVQINMTLTEKNQDEFGKMVSYYEKTGVHAIHPFFLVPAGRALSMEEDSLKEAAYYSMIRRVLEFQSSTTLELKPTCAPQFMPMAKEMGLSLRFSKGCLAGTAYCCILPEGQVNICPYLPVKAGNVREESFDEIWESSSVFLKLRNIKNYKGACGSCGYADICGGCRARAYYYNGSYLDEEPWCFRR